MTLAYRAIDTSALDPRVVRNLKNRWRNIGEAIDERADRDPSGIGWMYPDENDTWQDMSWGAFRDLTHQVAAGLLAIGVEPGSVVGISSSTSIRWVLADFAVNCIGAATAAIYPNTREDDVAFIVSDSNTQAIFVENATVYGRLRPAFGDHVRQVIVMNGEAPAGAYTWATLLEKGAAFLAQNPNRVRELIETTGPDTLATIIYTSGTTGRPKGVELTHDNWVYEATAWGSDETLYPTDTHFVWLPLTHAFGKCMLLIDLFTGAKTAVDGRIAKIVENMSIVKPTLMCGVPRIFEKVRAGTLAAAKPGSPKAKLLDWTMRVGDESFQYRSVGKKMPKALAAKYAIADKLAFSKVRNTLGGNVRMLISGSAKLDPDLQKWFFNMGIKLLEGYGVTETSAVTTFNKPQEMRFGTVGRLVPGTSAMIAENGEILLRGGGVMRAYHNDPELTSTMTEGGWYHTGDVGTIDEDGYLRLTDRIKDVIKTSNGKFVSPSEIEGKLTASSSAISQAVLVGEGHKYCVALVALDADWAAKWAENNGLELSYAEVIARPEIREIVQKDVDAVNATLSSWETVKKFAILATEANVDDGTATPTLKVRRAKVIEANSELIDSLYENEAMWEKQDPHRMHG